MTGRPSRFRNAHIIVASAAALVVLVSLALGWLGWRLLEQENALQRQEARDNLERSANVLQTEFFSRMAEREALLRSLGPISSSSALPSDGSIVVELKDGVQVAPPEQLLYLPMPPAPLNYDDTLLDEARKLEFQSGDLVAASATLSALAAKPSAVQPEALLLLARVQKKNKQIAAALATYSRLSNEKRISPSMGVPYGLLSRLQRSELLNESGQADAATREALDLLATLDAGEWALDKGAYGYYFENVRRLAGQSGQVQTGASKLAVAQAVESLWSEWRQFRRSGSSVLAKQLYSAEPVPVLSIANANRERMVALIYTGDALRQLLPDPAASAASGIRVDLMGQDGSSLLGGDFQPGSLQAIRSLSPAGIPWQLLVAWDGAAENAFASERRTYLILVLAAIILLVTLACYAMARGVIREASAGQLQSDFVSAVSHEFRSPLTTLRQLTELLAEGRIHDEGRRLQYFTMLQKETSRLHQLVEDLLDFGRMDAGRRQYRPVVLDFSELVREVVQTYQGESGASGHRIEVSCSVQPVFVEADREALHRVVRNLLENAVKYSPESRTVWVETDRLEHSAILRVRDQGIGIPPEEQSRIFEKFVRGDAAKRACIPGTGIGLAMVQEIVRVHHGEVKVSSTVGVGSTFAVHLPLTNRAATNELEEPQAVHGSAR
jgi:signal transduction histidine kinase